MGVIESNANVVARNSALIGEDVQLTAGRNFTLLADSVHTVDVRATGGSGGVVDLSQATTDVSVDDQTTSEIGDGSSIVAGYSLSVAAKMQTTADTRCDVDTYGLGADAETNATITFVGATTTTIGKATLRANEVTVCSEVTVLDIGAGMDGPMAESFAWALGTDSDARTTVTTNTTATVTVKDGARITGVDKVDVVATQRELNTAASARADTDGLGGDTDATASNTLTADTFVTSEVGAEITTRELLVKAFAPASPTYSATARKLGGWVYDPGDELESRDLNMNRAIHFNSNVILPGASPLLNIAADGTVTASRDITVTQDDSQVVVNDIRNTSSLGGDVRLAVPASDYDSDPHVTATITGHAVFEFQSGFESVTITNQSDKHLQIEDITVQNKTGQENTNVTLEAHDTSGFTWKRENTPGNPPIVIENTRNRDIFLHGVIDNPSGTVQVHTAGGDISAVSEASIATTGLTLNAPGGAIGTNDAPIKIEATLLNGSANDGIYVKQTAGNLCLSTVSSVAGQVNLGAAGSILDGTIDDSVGISAPTIVLSALKGSVGTVADPLEIDVSTGSLTASAAQDIVIVNVAGGLQIAGVVSYAGDIHVSTLDAAGPGQDLYLDDVARVRAELGSVVLSVGDALTAATGSSISAAETVTIIGDSDAADAAGAVIELSGAIRAASVQITGSDHGDLVSLTGVSADTPTTIDVGKGSDLIRIGSEAKTSSNADGLIDTIVGHLTVRGGADDDTLEIDDSGNPGTSSGKLTSTTVTGLGMSGVITYEGIEDLRIALGSGADSFTVASTHSGTTATLNAGPGDDTVDVRGTDNTLNAISGPLVILGAAGTNVLHLVDAGDDGPNSGTLSNTELTGLGMSGTVQYGDMAELLIELGKGNDTLTVLGTRANTEIRGQAGDDVLIVSGDLGQIAKPLLFKGGAEGADRLLLQSSDTCDLQLDKKSDPLDETSRGARRDHRCGHAG